MTNISFTEVLGPIMIGPSSSHTAGAVKLGLIANKINNTSFNKVDIILHGSFAKTYRGHGTDRAIIAGLMGMKPHDIRIKNSIELAKEQNLIINISEDDLGYYHPNTAKIIFYNNDSTVHTVIGSSIGGGSIIISEIDAFKISFTGEYPTLIINHLDRKGIISEITTTLAKNNINVASMNVTRLQKNKEASILIESDSIIPKSVSEELKKIDDIISIRVINIGAEL
ncbi:MAG: L-serine ammonia-lyase, iron-sulfur-dependent subunit beta [Clostridiales bacterium]|nr:L-serine ammonia-lyase, iron-sulfur-dependent subunit beta [Clostridiales bacterium]